MYLQNVLYVIRSPNHASPAQCAIKVTMHPLPLSHPHCVPFGDSAVSWGSVSSIVASVYVPISARYLQCVMSAGHIVSRVWCLWQRIYRDPTLHFNIACHYSHFCFNLIAHVRLKSTYYDKLMRLCLPSIVLTATANSSFESRKQIMTKRFYNMMLGNKCLAWNSS